MICIEVMLYVFNIEEEAVGFLDIRDKMFNMESLQH